MASTQLSKQQISQLQSQGCTAQDWSSVHLSTDTDLARIRNITFLGTVHCGTNTGSLLTEGTELPCGLYDATLSDCTIGDNVRISKVGSLISRYNIQDHCHIENVAGITASLDATFGNGVALDVINEAGGRSVSIYSTLNAQIAYLQGMFKHDTALTESLDRIVASFIKANQQQAIIEDHAVLLHCGPLHNVHIGRYARLIGIQYAENGTILSCLEHPTSLGKGVDVRSFIIQEGSVIDSGAILDKVFIGQGVKIGKQFSAENSMFFANCEGFHGEAVSLFAGPYTVTHHKSTLLIAGMFSFYNAGSGTNQSNHMYKLGPVHQGIFERGCKTGSFSYVLLESHLGPFSVVIGKHFTNINTPNLPFSYIHEEEGVSKIIPGMNLLSVGTVRDGEKWPKRDNRKAAQKRDLIIFDVFTPYVVEKMRRGRNELTDLAERTPKEKSFVNFGGTQLSRLLLKKGAKYYTLALDTYIGNTLLHRLEKVMSPDISWSTVVQKLQPNGTLQQPDHWIDIAGLITPAEHINKLLSRISKSEIDSVEKIDKTLGSLYALYAEDEWEYFALVLQEDYGINLRDLTKEDALKIIEQWRASTTSLQSMILEDSKREFSAFAKIGYGIGMSPEDRDQDFFHVRGSAETNSVVQKLTKEMGTIQKRFEQIVSLITHA